MVAAPQQTLLSYLPALIFTLLCVARGCSALSPHLSFNQTGRPRAMSTERMNVMLAGLESNSLFINSSDMGVKHCTFSFPEDNPFYPHSPSRLQISLHLYLKYMYNKGRAKLKGFLTSDTRDIAELPSEVLLKYTFFLRIMGTRSFRRQHVFELEAPLQSYWSPVGMQAAVHGFTTAFDISDLDGSLEDTHKFELSMNKDPQLCSFQPSRDLNLIDGRAYEVEDIDSPVSSSDTLHVLSSGTQVVENSSSASAAFSHPEQPGVNASTEPLVPMVVLRLVMEHSPTLMGPLVLRHVEYYHDLGVSKHIIYIQRDRVLSLLSLNTDLMDLVRDGKVIIVAWQDFSQHEIWSRNYDMRIIQSHALLAFTGLDVILLFVDLDEYLVTPKADLQSKSLSVMVRACGDAPQFNHPAQIQLRRYNALCKTCDRSQPESLVWRDYLQPQHPLLRYQITSSKPAWGGRSLVYPSALKIQDMQWDTLALTADTLQPQERCVYILHIANMLRVNVENAHGILIEDESWMGILRRISSRQKVMNMSDD